MVSDWPYTADAATVPSRETAQGPDGMADCVILFDGWPHTADAATVPSREAVPGLVGMADCIMIPDVFVQLFNEEYKKACELTSHAFLSGTDGARTHDLPHVKRTLIPAELRFLI